MGTLYYLTKDDPWEIFALNKVHEAYEVWERLQGTTLEGVFGTPEALAEALKLAYNSESGPYCDRAAARAFAWAKGARVTFCSEHELDDLEDAKRDRITGSFHDSDYEADGVTYKPGSAW